MGVLDLYQSVGEGTGDEYHLIVFVFSLFFFLFLYFLLLGPQTFYDGCYVCFNGVFFCFLSLVPIPQELLVHRNSHVCCVRLF